MWFRKAVSALILLALSVLPAAAQITIPYTFTSGTVISSAEVNAVNAALGAGALNRTGGTITGTIVVSAGITIDGVDLSAWLDQSVKIASTPTVAGVTVTGGGAAAVNVTGGVTSASVSTAALTVTGAGAAAIDVTGGINAGSGNVGIVDTTGKIPAISSTYFASLAGTNLTGVAFLGSANTFTAKNNLLTYTETRTAPTIGAGTLTLDLALGTHFDVALNANITTLTISNVSTSGLAAAFTLKFTADGTPRTVTWPASIKWPSAAAPTLTSTNGKIDVFTFVTYDGGTSFYGFVSGQNF